MYVWAGVLLLQRVYGVGFYGLHTNILIGRWTEGKVPRKVAVKFLERS
jgi:hypothetical protein